MAVRTLTEPSRQAAFSNRKSHPLAFERYSLLVYLLLLLAAIHCARAVFYESVSHLVLTRYIEGTERMPFQARIAMAPILGFAHQNAFLQRQAAQDIDHRFAYLHISDAASPEKLAATYIGVVCTVLLIAALVWYGRRTFVVFWWLPAVLALVMMQILFVVRYEQILWFPYDLPQCLLFGLACICIFESWWVGFALLFLLDIPMRETIVLLIPCLLAVHYGSRHWRRALALSAVLVVPWAAFRLWVVHRFAHNPSEAGVHYHQIAHSIYEPGHWPQIASAFAFLWIPLWLGRKRLSQTQYRFLLGALPGLFCVALFGIWYEQRIWGEWIAPAAILLTAQATSLLEQERVNPRLRATT